MLFKVFSLNTILLSVAAPIDKIASAKQGLVAEALAAHAACSGLEDNWPKDKWESWASSATDACEQWTDSKTGALQDGRTLAYSCTLPFARANCAQTCCTKAGTLLYKETQFYGWSIATGPGVEKRGTPAYFDPCKGQTAVATSAGGLKVECYMGKKDIKADITVRARAARDRLCRCPHARPRAYSRPCATSGRLVCNS